MLFVPSSDIKDSRNWSETLCVSGCRVDFGKSVAFGRNLTQAWNVDTLLQHHYKSIHSTCCRYFSCRMYNAFLLIEWYCCLRCFRHVLVFRTDICAYMSSSCLRCCSTLFDSRRLRDVVSLFSSCGYDTLSFNVR